MPITTKPFASQAQQRMAFARGMPWAKRWADKRRSRAEARAAARAESAADRTNRTSMRHKEQTPQERAMFAKMGSSGGGGKGGGGGGSKLWPKGPSGKRTPQAAAAEHRGAGGGGKGDAKPASGGAAAKPKKDNADNLPQDLRDMTPAQHRKVVDDLSKLPLSELRQRQQLTRQQQQRAYEDYQKHGPSTANERGAANLDIRDQHLRAAIDKQVFGESKPKKAPPKTKETSFQVYKDASGADRWVTISSTAYRDRDREIVSTKALQGAVALADASGYRGPLRFWHVPGVEIGDCDYQATAQDGRFLIESGTFRSPALAAAVKSRASAYQVSIGFTHPADEPDTSGVFSHIAIFERSLVPKGRASNPFTQVAIKELRMLTDEKRLALKELLGDESLLQDLLGQVATTDKAAQDQGVSYKETDLRTIVREELAALLGATEKAAPPPPVEEAPVEDEVKADEMVMEEEGGGDENFLSPSEISAIAAAVVQAITPLLDVEKKMAGHLNEMKGLIGGMGTQKDAALAEVKQELATVKEQIADLSGSQPRIMQGGYRASQATATVTTDESKLKEAQPSADPVSQSFASWLTDMGIGAQPQA